MKEQEEKIIVTLKVPKDVYYILIKDKGTKTTWYQYLIERNLVK